MNLSMNYECNSLLQQCKEGKRDDVVNRLFGGVDSYALIAAFILFLTQNGETALAKSIVHDMMDHQGFFD